MSTATYAAEGCSTWASETIDNAITAGIIPENLQSDYTSKITRREFCQLAMQTYMAKTGYTIPQGLQTPFTDVDDDYITVACMLGIVSGVGENKFAPDNNITRQEAAVMLNNLAEVSGVDNSKTKTGKFTDESYFADWAEAAIYKVAAIESNGTALMTGTGGGKFSPWMNYTREQAAATMYRLYNCKAVPVLVPQADGKLYYEDEENIYSFNINTNSVNKLVSYEDGYIRICAVSDNKIYYRHTQDEGRFHTLYRINTDGTENVAITPKAISAYLGYKHIYYTPVDAPNTVICTNLDGTNPITADLSKLGCNEKGIFMYINGVRTAVDLSKSGWNNAKCYIRADKNDTAYVYICTGTYDENDRELSYLYTYNFSDGTAKRIPDDTNTESISNETLCDGKYKYYIHRDVYDKLRNHAEYELHRCNVDGSADIILDSNLNSNLNSYDYYYENFARTIRLYKNKLYIPMTGPLSGEELCIYDGNGKSTKFVTATEGERTHSFYFMGINEDKIFYQHISGNYQPETHIHRANIDGTGDELLVSSPLAVYSDNVS